MQAAPSQSRVVSLHAPRFSKTLGGFSRPPTVEEFLAFASNYIAVGPKRVFEFCWSITAPDMTYTRGSPDCCSGRHETYEIIHCGRSAVHSTQPHLDEGIAKEPVVSAHVGRYIGLDPEMPFVSSIAAKILEGLVVGSHREAHYRDGNLEIVAGTAHGIRQMHQGVMQTLPALNDYRM